LSIWDLGRAGAQRLPIPLPPASKTQITFCVRGVISPLLANVYLHYVFDLWVEAWRKRVAKGDVIVVRYADGTPVQTSN
jgi:hypothetical protein